MVIFVSPNICVHLVIKRAFNKCFISSSIDICFDKFLLEGVFLRLMEFSMSYLDFRLAFNNFGTI